MIDELNAWLDKQGFSISLGLFGMMGSLLDALNHHPPVTTWRTALLWLLIRLVSSFLVVGMYGTLLLHLFPQLNAFTNAGVAGAMGISSTSIIKLVKSKFFEKTK